MAKQILNLSLGKIIDSPYQGRILSKEALNNIYTKKQLEELAKSIESVGLMQPITVRQVGDKYELIDGHRRVAAYKLLRKGNIPSIVKDTEEKNIQIMSLVANIQRSNLSNLERALAFEKILSNGIFKSKKELSIAIGKDETYVGDILNILKMDERIISDLAENNSISDVRLLRIIRNADKVNKEGRSNRQFNLYNKVTHEKLSRNQLSNYIKSIEKLKAPEESPSYEIKYQRNVFNIKLSQKLKAEKRDKLMKLLENKIEDLLKELED